MTSDYKIYFNNKENELLVFMIGENSIYNKLNLNNIILVEVKVNDWLNDLSPWPLDFKINGNTCSGHADIFLKKVLDVYENTLNYLNNNNVKYNKVVIGGYSLAGLFSLYAITKLNVFDYCFSVLGSLWFPNFLKYFKDSNINISKIYLSLGDKENKTKNLIMKTVLNNTLKLKEVLDFKKIINIFELNEGNHFKDIDLRLIKAINYLKN